MRNLQLCSPKSMFVLIGLAVLASACQGHYNPRVHVDEIPAKPGHVQHKYYH